MVEDNTVDGTAHRGLGRDSAIYVFDLFATDAPAVGYVVADLLVARCIPRHAVVFVVEVLSVVRVVSAFCRHCPERVERLVLCPDIASYEEEEHGEQG